MNWMHLNQYYCLSSVQQIRCNCQRGHCWCTLTSALQEALYWIWYKCISSSTLHMEEEETLSVCTSFFWSTSKLLMEIQGKTASTGWLSTSICSKLNLYMDSYDDLQNSTGVCSWGELVRSRRFACAKGSPNSESVDDEKVLRLSWISARI